LGFGFSLILSILMRCHVQAVTWIIIISVIVLLIILSVAMWYYGFRTEAGKKAKGTSKLNDKIFPAILVTFVQFSYCIAIFFLKKRIELAILLVQEAMTTLKNLTKLLLLPWLTSLVVVGAAAVWIYLALLIESAGVRSANGRYVKDAWTVAARWLNVAAFVWFLYFALSCQHMIVAGAVGKWYFTREKNNLTTSPVLWSAKNLLRFHLGSAATGFFLVLPIKSVLGLIEGCKFAIQAGHCDRGGSMQCLEYLSKSAYVIVALMGSPFFRAGHDAFHIVRRSGADLVTMKTIATLTFVGGKVFQINISLLIGVVLLKVGVRHLWLQISFQISSHFQNQPDVHHPEVIYLVEAVVGLLIVHCFLSVYQITIETIFICLCLDCQRNDGLYRPFFMTPKLKEFLKNARALDIRSPAHRGSVA
jgi:solute carrier family 44 (choline transporter-like protein), member 1